MYISITPYLLCEMSCWRPLKYVGVSTITTVSIVNGVDNVTPAMLKKVLKYPTQSYMR